MPENPGTPEPPKPPSPQPRPEGTPAPAAKPPVPESVTQWKKLKQGELPSVDPQEPLFSSEPPASVPANPAPPSPPPVPPALVTLTPDKKTAEPKRKLAFPRFSMLSKKPGALLSRRGKTEPTGKSSGESAPGAVKNPAPNVASISKVTLDPSHRKSHPEKLPHPRELEKKEATVPPTGGEPVSVPSKEVHRARPAWLRILLAVLIRIVVFSTIIGLGVAMYYQLRETRLEGFVNLPPGYKLKRVCLVHDFRPDAFNLVEELAMTRAPMQADITQLEEVVSRAKSDVAGREERLRLLKEEIETASREISDVMREAREASNKIWANEGKRIDDEYNQKKDAFHKKIADRATQLQLKYNENSDFKDPEVWVNAFRLSLYDAPKGVNTATEREWAEHELADWKKYVLSYTDQISGLKKQSEEFQSSPQTRITEANQRIDDLKTRISETETEVEPIQQELRSNQAALEKLRTEQAGLEAPFYKQIVDTPEGAIQQKINFDTEGGRFYWRDINRDPQYQPKEGQPGNYYLWVSVTSPKNQDYWSIVPVSLYYYRTTEIIIQPGALLSVRNLLNSGHVKP